MIDLRHPLALLSWRMPWEQIEGQLSPLLLHRYRPGVARDVVSFGPTVQIAGSGVSNVGRPRSPIRLMVSLLYLKHSYNERDESLVERWSQDVYFRYFSGMDYFEPRLPCDATQIGLFRAAIGEAGVGETLKVTIDAALSSKAIKGSKFERVIVDTTVHEKATAFPTDARLLEIARQTVQAPSSRTETPANGASNCDAGGTPQDESSDSAAWGGDPIGSGARACAEATSAAAQR
jgi:IS5 family transposase